MLADRILGKRRTVILGAALMAVGHFMMMGAWLTTNFFGGILAGTLSTFWSSMAKADFFLMLSILSATASAVIALMHAPLRRVLKD